MSATRVLLLGVLLAFAGVGLVAPAATAHYDVNVTVCAEGHCRCVNVVEVDSDRHFHTYCLLA